MSKTIRAFLAAALLGLPAAALAEAVEEKNLVSGKEKLDPESGYIFVQAPNRTFGLFFHDNTHHALLMGRAAAWSLRDDGAVDGPAWRAVRATFADHVVED